MWDLSFLPFIARWILYLWATREVPLPIYSLWCGLKASASKHSPSVLESTQRPTHNRPKNLRLWLLLGPKHATDTLVMLVFNISSSGRTARDTRKEKKMTSKEGGIKVGGVLPFSNLFPAPPTSPKYSLILSLPDSSPSYSDSLFSDHKPSVLKITYHERTWDENGWYGCEL